MYCRAEESSEATSSRKPDMRMKLPLKYKNKQRDLEILFLESSRPKAGVEKFIKDWIKLVRMSKRAHDKLFEEINGAYERLGMFDKGKEILDELLAVPIILIQVHCLEVKIAVLDWPYKVYHRVRVLENFTIPSTPPEDLELLRNFVYHFLQLLEYVDDVSSRLRQIWNEADALDKQEYFTRRSSTPPQSMSIDRSSELTRTPDKPIFYDVRQPNYE